jgi:S1-C subfamily serine protease
MRPGQHVTATVVRDGSSQDVQLTLGQLPGS